MKMKYFLIFLVLILSPFFNHNAMAQRCIAFDYDADGNRVEKMITNDCGNMRDVLEVQDFAEDNEICVYPNPTSGSFKIVVPGCIKNETSCFEVYDLNGALVLDGKLHDIETEVNMENSPIGVYLLKITNGNDIISRIVLKR